MKINRQLLAALSVFCLLWVAACGQVPTISNQTKKHQQTKQSKKQTHCITFYEHADFTGKSMKICEDNVFVGTEFNDIISSMKVDCGVKEFTLFEHRDYQGKSLTLTGCSEVIFAEDDQMKELISSVKIRRK